MSSSFCAEETLNAHIVALVPMTWSCAAAGCPILAVRGQAGDFTVASRSAFCLISLVSPRHGIFGPGTRTSGMRHALRGRLHSGRDRPGTVRANLVGDLCFRVCSDVILERLPIALLILYFLARQTDWQESLQGTNIRQSRLEFSKRALFFVLCPVTRC